MESPRIDCALTRAEALKGKEVPDDVRDSIELIDVTYISFDGALHQGQIIVHKDLVTEVIEIFEGLRALRFPIEKVVPVVAYDWDDNASMAANNSSAFNYRTVAGTDRLSNHSFGRAIDINPALNPYTQIDGLVMPPGAVYDPSRPGTFVTDSEAVRLFTDRGWTWGGTWINTKDWQHFEKP
ncbi:MAG TPA: M15 family metallopeptidase [Candidatus Paceibacterota bacterium]|nr:M15 family metallopeptidase [Candidatus Paceibacterota bacterium]